MKNPACAAVKREAEEDWGKRLAAFPSKVHSTSLQNKSATR
jgi:hypothetical protein